MSAGDVADLQSAEQWAVGLSQAGLVNISGVGLAHPDAGRAMQRLQRRASAAGFDLAIASGHRSYRRQLAIFNAKVRGERPVYSEGGQELLHKDMDDRAWLHAILRYSALPGTSRHHWGTDFDIWDRNAVAEDYSLRLEPAEYHSDGPFAELTDWLSTLIRDDDSEGFFRPYAEDRGGVAVEPWHLSHRPSATVFASQVSLERLLQLWSGTGHVADEARPMEALELISLVAAEAEALLQRYVGLDSGQ